MHFCNLILNSLATRDAALISSYFFLQRRSFMKKSLLFPVAISALALVLVAVMFVMNNSIFAAHASGGGALSIHVVEHAKTDTVGDADNGTPSPDALGNVLAFHNPVFNAVDKKQVGVDNAQCTRTIPDPTNGLSESFW